MTAGRDVTVTLPITRERPPHLRRGPGCALEPRPQQQTLAGRAVKCRVNDSRQLPPHVSPGSRTVPLWTSTTLDLDDAVDALSAVSVTIPDADALPTSRTAWQTQRRASPGLRPDDVLDPASDWAVRGATLPCPRVPVVLGGRRTARLVATQHLVRTLQLVRTTHSGRRLVWGRCGQASAPPRRAGLPPHASPEHAEPTRRQPGDRRMRERCDGEQPGDGEDQQASGKNGTPRRGARPSQARVLVGS